MRRNALAWDKVIQLAGSPVHGPQALTFQGAGSGSGACRVPGTGLRRVWGGGSEYEQYPRYMHVQ